MERRALLHRPPLATEHFDFMLNDFKCSNSSVFCYDLSVDAKRWHIYIRLFKRNKGNLLCVSSWHRMKRRVKRGG